MKTLINNKLKSFSLNIVSQFSKNFVLLNEKTATTYVADLENDQSKIHLMLKDMEDSQSFNQIDTDGNFLAVATNNSNGFNVLVIISDKKDKQELRQCYGINCQSMTTGPFNLAQGERLFYAVWNPEPATFVAPVDMAEATIVNTQELILIIMHPVSNSDKRFKVASQDIYFSQLLRNVLKAEIDNCVPISISVHVEAINKEGLKLPLIIQSEEIEGSGFSIENDQNKIELTYSQIEDCAELGYYYDENARLTEPWDEGVASCRIPVTIINQMTACVNYSEETGTNGILVETSLDNSSVGSFTIRLDKTTPNSTKANLPMADNENDTCYLFINVADPDLIADAKNKQGMRIEVPLKKLITGIRIKIAVVVGEVYLLVESI